MGDDIVKKLEEFINSPEGKQYSKLLSKQYEEKCLAITKGIERVKSPSYIKWLKSYIKDNDFIIVSPSIASNLDTQEDIDNARHLKYMFQYIDNYCSKNYYFPDTTNNGAYYTVKFDDQLINIGVMYSQGTSFSASIGTDKEHAVDFKDILCGRENPNKKNIQAKLYHLSCELHDLLDQFPADVIEEYVGKTIKEYKGRQYRK